MNVRLLSIVVVAFAILLVTFKEAETALLPLENAEGVPFERGAGESNGRQKRAPQTSSSYTNDNSTSGEDDEPWQG